MKRLGLIVLLLLSLPILLFVYQPAWQLGGAGLVLGIVGQIVSPIILFGALLFVIWRNW